MTSIAKEKPSISILDYSLQKLPELDELRILNWNQLANELKRVVESLSFNNSFRNMLSLVS